MSDGRNYRVVDRVTDPGTIEILRASADATIAMDDDEAFVLEILDDE